jgi:hypothetical protein
MSLPVGDWQFWVVTVVAVLALGWLTRNILPVPVLTRRARAKRMQKRVSITVGGKAVGK